jgi:hypothetical protein
MLNTVYVVEPGRKRCPQDEGCVLIPKHDGETPFCKCMSFFKSKSGKAVRSNCGSNKLGTHGGLKVSNMRVACKEHKFGLYDPMKIYWIRFITDAEYDRSTAPTG